jgi:hypothetical protein
MLDDVFAELAENVMSSKIYMDTIRSRIVQSEKMVAIARGQKSQENMLIEYSGWSADSAAELSALTTLAIGVAVGVEWERRSYATVAEMAASLKEVD